MRNNLVSLVLTLALALLASRAQAQCAPADQIAPNPNPAGNTISNSSGTACNGEIFENFGALNNTNLGTLVNSGTLNNNNVGTLNNLGLLVNAGTLDNVGTLDNAFRLDSQGPLVNGIGGTLVNSGTLTNLFTLDNVGTLNNSGTLYNFSTLDNVGTLNNSGTLNNNFWLTNVGMLNNVGTLQNLSLLFNDPGGTLVNSGTLHNSNGLANLDTLINTGTLNNFGRLDNLGALNNVSTLVNSNLLINSFALNNTGTLDNAGTLLNGHTLNNAGTLVNSGTLNNNSQQFSRINNSGLFEVSVAGAVTGLGTYTQTAGTTRIDGTMTQDAVNINGGVLQGAGTIISALVTVDGGTLAPGNSPGTLTIAGEYVQGAAGSFAAEIGGLIAGTEYDVLNVIGSATLDGTLNVSLYDLGSGVFAPSLGNTFDIILAQDIFGSFSTLSLAALGVGLAWQVSYLHDFSGTLDAVRLSVVSGVAPIPEPEIYAMMLAGLGVIGWVGRRKKFRAAFIH